MRRFSIAALMLVVLVCGVAVAALKQASDAWAGALLLLTLALLGSAVFGVRYRREGRQAFWLGFAVFGWGYVVLTMGPWFAEQVGPRLPTTQALSFAHARLHPTTAITSVEYMNLARDYAANAQLFASPPSRPAPSVIYSGLGRFSLLTRGNLEQFTLVGHCLFALLAAVVGGLIARGFQRTNRGVTTGVA